MSRKHYSDEMLLAHLDGQLSPWLDRGVQSHLKACWRCRARTVEFNDQIRQLTQAAEGCAFPGPSAMAAAKQRVLASCGAWERDFNSDLSLATLSRPTASPLRFHKALLATAAAVVLLCVSALILRPVRQPAAPTALAKARSFERNLFEKPAVVHQTFRVEARYIKPAFHDQSGRLVIWAEKEKDRFTSRWSMGNATRDAVWHSQSGHDLYFRPGAGVDTVNASIGPAAASLATLHQNGLTPEQIEKSFVHWLRSRRWQPICIANDFATFASEDGVLLRAEKAISADGVRLVRLVATRHSAQLTTELVLETEAGTARPRLESVRFETPEHTVEFRLVADSLEVVEPHGVPASAFLPDPSLIHPGPLSPARPFNPTTHSPVQTDIPGFVLDETEFQVLYALHQGGICRSEPVEVVRDPRYGITVRGIISSDARKQQVLSAINELSSRLVHVELKTVAESAAASASAVPQANNTDTPAQSIRVFQQRSSLEQVVRERFPAQSKVGSDVRKRIVDLSNGAITLADQAASEAWELKKLAEAFPAERVKNLRSRDVRLLEAMVHDHMSALGSHVSQMRALLAPLLPGSQTDASTNQPHEPFGRDDWQSLCRQIVLRANDVDDLIQQVFAEDGTSPAQVQNAITKLDSATPLLEKTLSQLQTTVEQNLAAVQPSRE